MTDVLPYGSWPSPITAADVAKGGVGLGYPVAVVDKTKDEADVWWVEGRPDEGGRSVIVSAARGDLLPAPWSARSRVHEYGGLCWLPLPDTEGPEFVFAEMSDQRLYRVDANAQAPRPLTPEPSTPAAMRYADPVLSPNGREVWCVREQHTGEGATASVTRAIVAVPLDGSAADNAAAVRVVVSGSQFLAYPTPSPDGGQLAWIAWDHPNMPWDSTELRVGELVDGVVLSWHRVLGGEHESVLEPTWADSTSLTDR